LLLGDKNKEELGGSGKKMFVKINKVCNHVMKELQTYPCE